MMHEEKRWVGVLAIPTLLIPSFDRPTRSPRCRLRRLRLIYAYRLANSVILALNNLSSAAYGNLCSSLDGFLRHQLPRSRVDDHDFTDAHTAWNLSLTQIRFIQDRVLFLARRHCRRLHDFQDQRGDECASILAELLESNYFSSSAKPRFIDDIERISLPALAGQVDLLANLSADLQAVYAAPNNTVLRFPPPAPSSLPKACTLVRRGVYGKFIAKLLRCGVVEPIDDPACENGVFLVDKSDGTFRLIADMRPGACFFNDPPELDLPTVDRIAELSPPAEALSWTLLLEVGKRDLRDFFYRWRAPKWMWRFMALKRVKVSELDLSPAELSQWNLDPDGYFYPAFCVMAMGHPHSPALTQNAHENIVYSRTSLRREDALTRFTDRRLDRLRHLICLDDVICLGLQRANLVQPALDEYERVVEQAGLRVKHSKSVNATSEPVECLGADVDGATGLVSMTPRRFLKLAAATMLILNRGYASGDEISALVGGWAWAMLLFRPALSVFRVVYKFAGCARKRRYRLWNSVREELSAAVALAPLYLSDLRTHCHSRALASDASELGYGVCAAPIQRTSAVDIRHSSNLQYFAFRHSQRLHESNPNLAQELELPRSVRHFVQHSHWTTLFNHAWERPEHINPLECRAVLAAVRWASSVPSAVRSHLTLFTDSRVVMFAVNKGRSSARLLYHRVKLISAYLLAFGIRLRLVWIPSDMNPADAPSRAFPPRRSYRSFVSPAILQAALDAAGESTHISELL